MKVAKVGVVLSGDSVVAIGSTTKLTTTKKASSRAKITYTSSDETIATDPETLVEFLTEKGHPALGMDPMM